MTHGKEQNGGFSPVGFARFVLAFGLLAWPSVAGAEPRCWAQPPGWDAGLRLPEATDINPDPRVVEVNLEARIASVEIVPGKTTRAWTYDGGIPGPLIRVHVGDRLIVHFTNRLPQPTTVHWHGVRVPIQMDGVPGISQPEVVPGESFTYDFIVPDAGLFWYHPHVMSAAQVGFGLYGALLVEDPDDKIDVPDQLVMVLSDIDLKADGSLESPETSGSAGMAFGREGDYLLVNGRTHGKLMARAGARQRWRVVNAAKSRFFDLAAPGVSFTKIGGDGGLQEYAETLKDLVLAPGERADVIVTVDAKPATEVMLTAVLYNRGYGSIEARAPVEDLLPIVVADAAPIAPSPIDFPHRPIERLDTTGATPVTMKLTIAQLFDGSFEYGINGAPYATSTPFHANVGETQVWTIVNETAWSHPFHLHGFFFQVLDDKGNAVHPIVWKDTINVPFKQTMRVAVRFEDRPGNWMIHCHVLDHADGGLMGTIVVGDVIAAHHAHEH